MLNYVALYNVSVAYQHFRKDPGSFTWGRVGARRGHGNRQGIEFFGIEPALQFRVVAVKMGTVEVKETASAK